MIAKVIALRAHHHGTDDLRRLARAPGCGGCLLWLRFMTARGGRRPRGVAGSAFRSCGNVPRFNGEGSAGLVNAGAPITPPRLTPEQRAALAQAVEAGPQPEVHGVVVRWRLIDLLRWLRDEFGKALRRKALGRELRRLAFQKLSARPPDRAQDPEAVSGLEEFPRRAEGDPYPAVP